MEFIDSIDIEIFDINRCTKCNEIILPGDETCETLNDSGGIYKIDHFNCAFPQGKL